MGMRRRRKRHGEAELTTLRELFFPKEIDKSTARFFVVLVLETAYVSLAIYAM